MKISKNCVVTLTYRVIDKKGTVLDTGNEPLIYLHGGYKDVFEKVEQALEGKSRGDEIEVSLLERHVLGLNFVGLAIAILLEVVQDLHRVPAVGYQHGDVEGFTDGKDDVVIHGGIIKRLLESRCYLHHAIHQGSIAEIEGAHSQTE